MSKIAIIIRCAPLAALFALPSLGLTQVVSRETDEVFRASHEATRAYQDAVRAYQEATRVYGDTSNKGSEVITTYAAAIAAYNKAIAEYGSHVPLRHPTTVKLDPDSIRQIADALSGVPAPTPRDSNLWSQPAFQTLMSTLWQAPLAILAIVLGVAAFFGWQGYRELEQRLQTKLTARFEKATENRFESVVCTTYLRLAHDYWKLSEDIAGSDGRLVDSDDVPPRLSDHGFAHVVMAKHLLETARERVGNLPEKYKVNETATKETTLLSISQSWAYHVATTGTLRPSTVSRADWEDAVHETARFKVLWAEYRKTHAEKVASWLDTYLYVRVLYARQLRSRDSHRAQLLLEEARTALLEYRDSSGFAAVAERFAALL